MDAAQIVVIDGDTVAIKGQRVRLTGFDTPETFDARCEYERDLGQRARERLKSLLRSGKVELVAETGRDRYGRMLARLQVDGEDVGIVLIREGLAVRYERGKRRDWCR